MNTEVAVYSRIYWEHGGYNICVCRPPQLHTVCGLCCYSGFVSLPSLMFLLYEVMWWDYL
jgi:hypothetical protein